MANMLFANNCNTTLASSLTSGATSMSVTSATGFPSPTGVQYFYCTLADAATQTTIEIVKVTSVTGTTFAITRGQDGTTGTAFAAGAVVSLRLVRASLNDFPKLSETNTFNADQSIVGALTTSAGLVSTNTFTATPPSDGLVMDYATGFGRFSAFAGDGFQWYNAGVANTKLMQLSSTGVITTAAWNGATVTVPYGGTGLTTLTAGYIPYGNGTSAFASSSALTYNGTNLIASNEVLIGTTTSQGGKLAVNGITVQMNGSSTFYVNSVADSSSYIKNDGGSGLAQLDFYTAATHRMQIGNAGGVSIGNTTDPGAGNLSVTGKAIIQGLTVGTGGGSGTANTVLGNGAANAFSSSSYNTIVGYQAGYSNASANYCTLLGWQAGYSVTGNANICVGAGTGASLTTGINNIHFGYTAASSGSAASEFVLGASNSLITGKGSNTGFIAVYNSGYGSIYQGNNSATWSIISDQRLKKNIVDNTIGLSAITQIQVRNFEYCLPEEITELPKENAIEIPGVQLGAIAQELHAILPDCVKTQSTGVMSVDTTNLTWYLVNAVKELKAQIDDLKQQLGK